MRIKFVKILSVFILVFLCVTICSCSDNEQKQEQVETYEVLNTLTYEDKVEELMSQFDTYSSHSNNNSLYFDGEIYTTYNESQIDYLSTSNEKITKKYSAELDTDSGVLYLTVSYVDDGVIVKYEQYETLPYYDACADDYLFEFENQTFSMASMILEGSINECVAAVDDAVVIGGCAVLLCCAYIVTAVSQDPTFQRSIETIVTQVTQTITTVVKSIISWFKSLFKTVVETVTKTVVSTIETIKTIYNYNVAGIDFEFTEADTSRCKDDGSYYLAIADISRGGGGKVYFSTMKIDRNFAVAVLRSAMLVEVVNHIGNTANVYMSTYTYDENDAKSIASEASLSGGVIRHSYHNKKGYAGTYFEHFHPCYPYFESAHSFFGDPSFI